MANIFYMPRRAATERAAAPTAFLFPQQGSPRRQNPQPQIQGLQGQSGGNVIRLRPRVRTLLPDMRCGQGTPGVDVSAKEWPPPHAPRADDDDRRHQLLVNCFAAGAIAMLMAIGVWGVDTLFGAGPL
jgi:hypothetical protein